MSGTTAFLGGTVFAGLLAFLMLKGGAPGTAGLFGGKAEPVPTNLPTVSVSQLPQPSPADPLEAYNDEQKKKEADQLKSQLDKQVSETEQLKAQVEKQSTEAGQYKTLLEKQSDEAKQLKAQVEKQTADFEQSKAQLEKQRIETDQLKSQLRNQQIMVDSLTAQVKASATELQNQQAQSIFGERSTNYLAGFAWMLTGVLVTAGGGLVVLRLLAMSSQRDSRQPSPNKAKRYLRPTRYPKLLLPPQRSPQAEYGERRYR